MRTNGTFIRYGLILISIGAVFVGTSWQQQKEIKRLRQENLRAYAQRNAFQEEVVHLGAERGARMMEMQKLRIENEKLRGDLRSALEDRQHIRDTSGDLRPE
jgi:hypothetical protein